MREKTLNIYTLEELSPEARKRAIEAHRDFNVNGCWWDGLHEDFSARLAEVGLSGRTFYWSIFGQGRGIWCDDLEIADLALLFEKAGAQPAEGWNEDGVVSLYLRGDRQKSNRFRVALDSDHISGTMENALNSLLGNLLAKFLGELEAEYDYLTSDEAVAESLGAAGVEFVALGDAWPDRWEREEEKET